MSVGEKQVGYVTNCGFQIDLNLMDEGVKYPFKYERFRYFASKNSRGELVLQKVIPRAIPKKPPVWSRNRTGQSLIRKRRAKVSRTKLNDRITRKRVADERRLRRGRVVS